MNEKRTMEPGLHLQVWTGTPDYVKAQLREWFLAEEPLMIINLSQGFSGGDFSVFYVSVVYQQTPRGGIVGAMPAPVGRGM